MKRIQTLTLVAAAGIALALTLPAASSILRGDDVPVSAAPTVPGKGAADPRLADLAVLDFVHDVSRTGDAQDYDEPYCDARDTVAGKLTQDFRETPVAAPERIDGLRVELWASAETRTWSLLATRADGVACVVETGRNWSGRTDVLRMAAN